MKNFKKVCPVLLAIVMVTVIAIAGAVTAFATEGVELTTSSDIKNAVVRVYAANHAKVKYFTNLNDALAYASEQTGNVNVFLLADLTINETIVFNDDKSNTIEIQSLNYGSRTATITCTTSEPFMQINSGKIAFKNLKIVTKGDAFFVDGGTLNLQAKDDTVAANTQYLTITSDKGSCVKVKSGSVNILGGAHLNSSSKVPVIQGIENGNVQISISQYGAYTSVPTITAPEEISVISGIDSVDVEINRGNFSADVKEFCSAGYTTELKNECWVVIPAVLKVNQLNMRFGESLSLLFAMKQTNSIGDGCYAIITQADKTTKIEFASWLTTTINGNPYYVVEYSGIAAKEMTDEVTIQFFAEDGTAISADFTTTIQSYAMNRLKNSGDDTFKTMLVDMLNYGAAAQEHFKYKNSDTDLANALLTEDQKAWATETMKTCENKRVVEGDAFMKSGARFFNAINLLFKVEKEPAKAVFTFENHRGAKKEITVTTFAKDDDGYVAELNGLVIADARQEVTCVIYDADGNVIVKVVDSIESYVARASTNDALYTSFMKFADASYAYFHKEA